MGKFRVALEQGKRLIKTRYFKKWKCLELRVVA
jgi:hypothetical protein